MTDCPHEIWVRESDVTADGSCPICLRAEIERLRAALQRIADDGKNCQDFCRNRARAALERYP